MDKDQKTLFSRLLGINAIMMACPVLLAEAKVCGDRFPVLGGIMLLGSIPLFVLSFAALSWIAWRGVAFYRMTKMEAWWWLSTPYSAALPLSILVLQLQEFVAHVLILFVLISFVTTLSSTAWALVTIYRVAVSRNTKLTTKKKTMLALVLLAVLLWMASLVSPS